MLNPFACAAASSSYNMRRAQVCALLATIGLAALAFGQPQPVGDPAECWNRSSIPATLAAPAQAHGKCVRVLALGPRIFVPLDQALGLAAKGRPRDVWLDVLHAQRASALFETNIDQLPLDIRPWTYSVLEGRWDSSAQGRGMITNARVRSVTLEEAQTMAPALTRRIAATRMAAAKLPPTPFSSDPRPTIPLAEFPDSVGLQTILSRLTHRVGTWPVAINPEAVAALVLARERAPAVIRSHANEIRAAFVRADAQLRSSDRTMRTDAYCLVLDECRDFEALALERIAATPLERPTAHGGNYSTRQWAWFDKHPGYAIAWLAGRTAWDARERAVFEQWVARPLETRLASGGAPLPIGAPQRRPANWPSPGDVTRDLLAAEWRALTSGDRWGVMGDVAVAGETEDATLNGEPPAQPPSQGPAASALKLSIVNFGPTPVRVQSDAVRLLVSGRTRTAEVSPRVDVEVPPRTWLIWRGHFQAPGSVPVRVQSTLVITIRAGSRSATVNVPFRVVVVS